MEDIAKAMAAGEITPGELESLANILTNHAKTMERVKLEQKLVKETKTDSITMDELDLFYKYLDDHPDEEAVFDADWEQQSNASTDSKR
jgi:hypothetical protein